MEGLALNKLPRLLLQALVLMAGCSAKDHMADVNQDGDKMTVGTVQKEIRVGMSGADVAGALGSPNIVTTDEARREVWVYDKMSRTTAYSKSDVGVGILVLGFSSNTGATSSSQRTLTVIIKFDENKKVRDFAYHSSSF
jgi:outer membrane protein assembly factor BamE (lipoprotein component of BamABCDE complex)